MVKQISLLVSDEDHQRIKLEATKREMSMKKLIMTCVKEIITKKEGLKC